MPPVNDPQKQDPAPTGGAPQSGKPPQDSTQVAAPAPPPGGWVFKSPLFDGDFTGRITQPSPTQYQGLASYLFKNGDTLGANALLGTQPFSLENYGANGTFGLGRGGSASLGFDVQPPKGTSQWLADLKFGDGSLLNANLATAPQGDIFKTNGLWAIGKGQQLTGSAELNGVENFSDLKLKWTDRDLHFFNFGLNDTKAGTVIKGDGQATLKPGELVTGGFELNGPTKTNDFKLNWNDNGKHFLNLNLNDSPAGTLFKGDGQATLKPGELVTGNVELNGATKTNDFKLNWNDNGKHFLNLNLNDSPAGTLFKGDGQATLKPGELVTGGVELNGVTKTNDFKLNWNDNGKHFLNLNLNDSPAGTLFKGDGQATLKPGELVTGGVELNGITKTNDFKLNWNDNGKHFLNLNLNDSPAGTLFKGDGQATLKPGELVTGNVELNGITKTNDFKLNWNDNGKHFLNLNLNDSPAGTLFKGDGQATLKPGGLLTGAFESNGPAGTQNYKLNWNDNGKHLFDFDYKAGKDGSLLKLGSLTTLRPGDTLGGSLELNGIEKYKQLNLNGNFQDRHSFGIDFRDDKAGSILKVNGKTTFGEGNVLLGSAEWNRVENFKDYKLGYSTLGGSKFDLGLRELPGGSIYSADAKVMLDKKDHITGNLLINGVEKTKEFGLGANIKNNVYNFNLSDTPFGTNVGFGAKLSFDDGNGKVGLDGKFGPKLSEANGMLSYKYKDLEYGGNIKFNNADGRFGLAELGAKVTKGDDRFRYGLEASINPHTGDYKVMAGISISFGGGSKRSSSPEPRYTPPPSYDRASDFASKPISSDASSVGRLNPNDRALFDQAKTGVEKLNAQGASFNVERTAMYLAALGNEKGFDKIDKVELGKPMADGRQNLFIFDREPTNPFAKSVMADSATASNTSLRASVEALQRTPDIADVRGGAAAKPNEPQANPDLSTPKRGY